ncbi:MAG: hypothetical protein K9J12_06605 [Melioribacteraceae bacterium]|nr:hypothetical protein [Melioribacteraceae bacterium]MCF8264923.1 hypothetical protein [Melioribacteraceae bacterium]
MKLGCIIKSFFLVVTIIGIAYYVYENYGDEIIDKSKERIAENLSENIISLLGEKGDDLNPQIKDEILNFVNKVDFSDTNFDIDNVVSIYRQVEVFLEKSDFEPAKTQDLINLLNAYEK